MSLKKLPPIAGEPDLFQTGDWMNGREIWFLHDRNPYDVKFALETMTGQLLESEAGTTETLSYLGSSESAGVTRNLRLDFRAVVLVNGVCRNLFCLSVQAIASRQWFQQEEFLTSTARMFEFWAAQLERAPPELSAGGRAAAERYPEQVQLAKAREREMASRVEDQTAIEAVKCSVLDGLRNGLSFRTAHHEGGTRLFFHAGRFWREDFGEEPATQEYATPEQMLRALREFYDWDSRRHCYPHRPPELEVWNFIHRNLH